MDNVPCNELPVLFVILWIYCLHCGKLVNKSACEKLVQLSSESAPLVVNKADLSQWIRSVDQNQSNPD